MKTKSESKFEQVSGIIWLKFKPGVSEEQIQETVSNIYLKNASVISGMEYGEFKGEQEFAELRKQYKDWAQKSEEAAHGKN